jgi:hypothetical protein
MKEIALESFSSEALVRERGEQMEGLWCVLHVEAPDQGAGGAIASSPAASIEGSQISCEYNCMKITEPDSTQGGSFMVAFSNLKELCAAS